nr:hypothetical protein [Eubacterium sp.]
MRKQMREQKDKSIIRISLMIIMAVILAVGYLPMVAKANALDDDDDEIETVWTDYIADSYDGGAGTEYDPYQISTGAQLAKFVYSKEFTNDNNGNVYAVLTRDIDLSEHHWVTAPFYSNGEFTRRINLNGNDHIIAGLTQDSIEECSKHDLKPGEEETEYCAYSGFVTYGFISNIIFEGMDIDITLEQDNDIDCFEACGIYCEGTLTRAVATGYLGITVDGYMGELNCYATGGMLRCTDVACSIDVDVFMEDENYDCLPLNQVRAFTKSDSKACVYTGQIIIDMGIPKPVANHVDLHFADLDDFDDVHQDIYYAYDIIIGDEPLVETEEYNAYAQCMGIDMLSSEVFLDEINQFSESGWYEDTQFIFDGCAVPIEVPDHKHEWSLTRVQKEGTTKDDLSKVVAKCTQDRCKY